MARTKSKALSKPVTGQSLATIDSELTKEAADLKARIGQPGGKAFKIKPTGDFIGPDGNNYGPEIQVVVLDFISKNMFYPHMFDANSPTPPDCFAVGKDIEAMVPVDQSPHKQNKDCKTCSLNVFGSGKNGKSKACKNTREIAFLLADEESLSDDKASVYTLSIPPTSIKAFDGAAGSIARSLGGPPIKAVITLVGKNVGTYATISFVDPVPNPNYAQHAGRRVEANELLNRLPDFTQRAPAPKAPRAPVRGRR
jgi:hypothetical protein